MSSKGVFGVSRDVFDNPLFKKEPFTEREAWIWLLAQASYKARRVRTTSGRAVEMVDLNRGQLSHSRRFMQVAWRWQSEKKVRSFLKRLEMDALISLQTDALQTVITICKYEDYQFSAKAVDAQTDAQTGQTRANQGPEKETRINKKEDIGRSLGFEDWYRRWPRKRHPDAARRSYNRIVPSRLGHAELISKTEAFVADWQRSKRDLKFCPYPAKWLDDGGFDDEMIHSGKVESAPPPRDPSTFSDSDWQKRLANFKASGEWSAIWGPVIGKPGCLVPRHLLVSAVAS